MRSVAMDRDDEEKVTITLVSRCDLQPYLIVMARK